MLAAHQSSRLPTWPSPVWEVLQLRKLLRMLRENGNLPWMEGDSNWSRYHHQLCRLGSRQWLQHQHLEKPWLSCSTQLRPMGPPPREFFQLIVSDLILPDRNEWDIDMIQRVLPFEEQRILAIKPKDAGSIEDGSFDWKKSVWKLQTTPKIKLFIWKALHGALPVNEALKARGINTDGQCKRCNMPEFIDHLLFHCSYARQVWKSAPVSPSIEYSGSIDLRSNWSSLCSRKSLPPTGVSTGALAPWITWQLWLARNKLVFEGKIITVEETISRASACAQEWISCQDQVKNANLISDSSFKIKLRCSKLTAIKDSSCILRLLLAADSVSVIQHGEVSRKLV
ncbi:hypothetical protein Bca101_029987 [Brassica carinata]